MLFVAAVVPRRRVQRIGGQIQEPTLSVCKPVLLIVKPEMRMDDVNVDLVPLIKVV